MDNLNFKDAEELYKKLEFESRMGFGEKPAIFLVDFQYILTRG